MNELISAAEKKLLAAQKAEMVAAIEFMESVVENARHNLEYRGKIFGMPADQGGALSSRAFSLVYGQASLPSDDGGAF